MSGARLDAPDDPGRVFILDEIVVKPGSTAAYCAAYRREYVPAAERRGMTMRGSWRNPPVQDLGDLPTTLYYLWSVADVAGWWRMRLSRMPDGADERFEKLRWWQEADAMTVSRRRTVLSALDGAAPDGAAPDGTPLDGTT